MGSLSLCLGGPCGGDGDTEAFDAAAPWGELRELTIEGRAAEVRRVLRPLRAPRLRALRLVSFRFPFQFRQAGCKFPRRPEMAELAALLRRSGAAAAEVTRKGYDPAEAEEEEAEKEERGGGAGKGGGSEGDSGSDSEGGSDD